MALTGSHRDAGNVADDVRHALHRLIGNQRFRHDRHRPRRVANREVRTRRRRRLRCAVARTSPTRGNPHRLQRLRCLPVPTAQGIPLLLLLLRDGEGSGRRRRPKRQRARADRRHNKSHFRVSRSGCGCTGECRSRPAKTCRQLYRPCPKKPLDSVANLKDQRSLGIAESFYRDTSNLIPVCRPPQLSPAVL